MVLKFLGRLPVMEMHQKQLKRMVLVLVELQKLISSRIRQKLNTKEHENVTAKMLKNYSENCPPKSSSRFRSQLSFRNLIQRQASLLM